MTDSDHACLAALGPLLPDERENGSVTLLSGEIVQVDDLGQPEHGGPPWERFFSSYHRQGLKGRTIAHALSGCGSQTERAPIGANKQPQI